MKVSLPAYTNQTNGTTQVICQYSIKVVGLTAKTDIFNLSALVSPKKIKDAYPFLESKCNVGRQIKKFPGVDIYINDILFAPTYLLDFMLTIPSKL